MISAALDWYYGSPDEEILADCEFGEPYSTKHCSNKDVCVRPATLGNGMQVTIFTQMKSTPKEVTDLEKSSRRMKVLRHPNILRHIGCVSMETQVHLVTERVSPLYLQFQTADANEVSSGIYDIAQALKFLHEKASMTHNTVNIESIYITEGGAWKLSGFEWACPFNEATTEYLSTIKRPTDIIPPEDKNNKLKFPLDKKYAHCRDVYAVGVLLAKFHQQTRFASQVPSQELEDLLEEILQRNYKARPQVTEILDTAALTSEYISIVNFLQSITLKSKIDKTRFFSRLISQLEKACISDELVAKRIVKLLLSPVVLAENEAVENIIPRLLTPKPLRRHEPSIGLISSSMFARYVIPQIVDLLEVKILHVRLVLIENFHRYVHMFESSVLKEVVLPEVLLGLHDANNQLVKASLHALADAVPTVGADIIVGTEREKIFNFGMPKFNGSVLVDTSSLAYELKPKRKPKRPKKKKPQEKRPATLLELAMSRDTQRAGRSGKSQQQRDLMMLKQSELASTLRNSQTNGAVTPNEGQILINGEEKEESVKLPMEARVNGIENGPPKILNGKVAKEEANKDVKLPEKEVQYPKEPATVVEPEIETWVGSGSDDNMDDNDWDDFDDFKPVAMTTEKRVAEENDKELIDSRKDLRTQSPEIKNTAKQTEDLGNEFEIAVKIKPPSPEKEPDFFADMAPEISTKKALVLPIGQQITRQKRNSLTSTITTESSNCSPISVSFNAIDDGNEADVDGWEDDIVSWDE